MSEALDLFSEDWAAMPVRPMVVPERVHAPFVPSLLDVLFASISPSPHLLAFVAQARHHGHTDPALEPIRVDSAGRRLFNETEIVRFANELLRGVRSDRPAMTPERWAQAIAKAREAHHAI